MDKAKQKTKQNKFKKKKKRVGAKRPPHKQNKQTKNKSKQTNKKEKHIVLVRCLSLKSLLSSSLVMQASGQTAFFKDSDTGWPFRPNKVCRLVPLDFLLLNLIVSNGEWGLISLGRPTGGR